MLKAIYGNTQQIYISTLYIKFHQVKHYIHFNIPIYKKQENLVYDFILSDIILGISVNSVVFQR